MVKTKSSKLNKKENFKVEKIITKVITIKNETRYLVKWKDRSHFHNSWEPVEVIPSNLLFNFGKKKQNVRQYRSHGFARYKIMPEKIVGLTKIDSETYGVLKWPNYNQLELVHNSIMREHCPDMLLDFYESAAKIYLETHDSIG